MDASGSSVAIYTRDSETVRVFESSEGRKETPLPVAERAIIYRRVSTDEQARGSSLATQLESCRRYCADRGYSVLADFSDAQSGTQGDRPGLNATLDAVKTLRPEVIVLYHADRLGRDNIVQALAERDLTRYGARIEYVMGGGTGSPEQELLKGTLQVIAIYDNRLRTRRTKEGQNSRVRDGNVLVAARPPYGYRYIGGDRKGRLERDPDEAPIVQRIFRWYVDDGLTTYEIAKRLHAEQIPTRGDRNSVVVKKSAQHVWAMNTIARILRTSTYKGEWFYNKSKLVDADDELIARWRKAGLARPERKRQIRRPRSEWLSTPVPALVDEAMWERAQERLARNRQMARRNAKREYLLRGLVFCSCGRRMSGRAHRGYAYYRCSRAESHPWHNTCTARINLEQSQIESAVLDAVKAFLKDPDMRRAALGAERERVSAEREQLAADLATIDQSRTRVDRQLGKLLDDLLLDDFPAEIVAKRKRDLVSERHRLAAERERRLAALDEPIIDVEAVIAELEPAVEMAFALAEPAELRQLLELLRVEVQVIDREHVRLSGVIGGHCDAFSEMSGSGNDVIVIDIRRGVVTEDPIPELTRRLCRRRLSMGADGVVLIAQPRPEGESGLCWRYFNADGSEGEMRSNGAMCGARFALLHQIAIALPSLDAQPARTAITLHAVPASTWSRLPEAVCSACVPMSASWNPKRLPAVLKRPRASLWRLLSASSTHRCGFFPPAAGNCSWRTGGKTARLEASFWQARLGWWPRGLSFPKHSCPEERESHFSLEENSARAKPGSKTKNSHRRRDRHCGHCCARDCHPGRWRFGFLGQSDGHWAI
jgi:site-specific DNA recombinase